MNIIETHSSNQEKDIMAINPKNREFVSYDNAENAIASQIDDIFAAFEQESLMNIKTGSFDSVEDATIAFDDGLEKAVLKDDEAFSIITSAMDYMKNSGEFERVAQMAMTLGAMACNHDHMQGFANSVGQSFSESFVDRLKEDNHDHDHGIEHDDDEDSDDKKKKKKRFWWQ